MNDPEWMRLLAALGVDTDAQHEDATNDHDNDPLVDALRRQANEGDER